MLEEFGGIFLALSTLFRESASDLFFLGGENKTSKITWDFFPKNSRLLFFFFLWWLLGQSSWGRSILWSLRRFWRNQIRFRFFGVLSFDFVLFLFFCRIKRLSNTGYTLNCRFGSGVWSRAGICWNPKRPSHELAFWAEKKQTNLQQIPQKKCCFPWAFVGYSSRCPKEKNMH